MTALIVFICLVMLGIIVVQISRVRELSAAMRGEEQASINATNRNGLGLMIFMVLFLVATVASAVYYKDSMLGYGPWESSSAHGGAIDSMVNVTLFFTGIVFIATHIVLFWFAYRFRQTRSKKADYISHDNKLEVVWTLIPALVMTGLVVGGLDAWNEVMADVPDEAVAGDDYIEIEATGYQFAWDIRYPGEDGLIGTKDFRMISGINPLGQDWTDAKNHDDFLPTEIVLPVNVPVRVRITSKDVLHNFYLPHFRVKMDAVPGMPTYFVFTPTVTTDSMRRRLSTYPDYMVPSDPNDPESEPRWKSFNYELACAELCGTGHNSMRRLVRIVERDEYVEWLAGQPSYYLSTIRNTADDPYKGQPVAAELKLQKQELFNAVNFAISGKDSIDRVVRLKNISYETGSANLTAISSYELDNVVEILQQYPNIRVEIAGHTDNTGDADANVVLSEARAESVASYLTGHGIDRSRFTAVRGYGASRPAATNDTEEGRAENRRTEFIVEVSPSQEL
jgi:cytochrome c oxidase subunit 2